MDECHPRNWHFVIWGDTYPFGQDIHEARGSSKLGKVGLQEDSSLSPPLQRVCPGTSSQATCPL